MLYLRLHEDGCWVAILYVTHCDISCQNTVSNIFTLRLCTTFLFSYELYIHLRGLCKYAKPNLLYCFSNSTVLLIIIMKEYIYRILYPFFYFTCVTTFLQNWHCLIDIQFAHFFSVIGQILIVRAFFNFVNPTLNLARRPQVKVPRLARDRVKAADVAVSLHSDWRVKMHLHTRMWPVM